MCSRIRAGGGLLFSLVLTSCVMPPDFVLLNETGVAVTVNSDGDDFKTSDRVPPCERSRKLPLPRDPDSFRVKASDCRYAYSAGPAAGFLARPAWQSEKGQWRKAPFLVRLAPDFSLHLHTLVRDGEILEELAVSGFPSAPVSNCPGAALHSPPE